MKPYIPESLPIETLDYKRLIKQVGRANAELARYDGLLQAIVNPEILLSPLTTREAVLSSKIEGTQATLDEVLKQEAGISVEDENKRKDIREIVNYRSALILAEKTLADRPVSLFLIRQMHKVLMESVRGHSRNPGEFRKRQNWIGKPGASIKEASFVPPEPHVLTDQLQALEQYIQSDDVDVLIQCAVVHAQFELIHPFLDGNGRIGRLLIPLFLYYKKRLSRPMFYMSAYLENYRDVYYEKLANISKEKDWNGWLEFFLRAVSQQAVANSTIVQRILELYKNMKDHIFDVTRSQYSLKILDAIFDRPIFRPTDMLNKTNIPKQTLMPILKQLQEAGILDVLREARGRQAAVLVFSRLLEITEGRE